jgi:hypothetical protein
MSATAAPYGLIPVNHPSGVIRPFAMTIITGYGTTIYQNQPVAVDATTGGIVAAAVGAAFIGSFQGVEFTDTDGKRRVANKWTASTSGTDIVAYVTLDPSITYQIQSNAALALADVGSQYNTTAITNGNTTTGLSSMALDVSTVTTSGVAQLRFIGIVPGADNNYGDTYVNALVQISKHQNVATVNAY